MALVITFTCLDCDDIHNHNLSVWQGREHTEGKGGVYKDGAVAAPEALPEEELREEVSAERAEQLELSRHLLRAVETYKASCQVAGEEPTEEDSWLVLLSALQHEGRGAAA